MTNRQFYDAYKQAANDAAAGTKVFPETILAAASLESGNGTSLLAFKYNNFFGIKAGSSWKGNVVKMATKEQDAHGKVFTVMAAFRHYNTPKDSFANYVKFISGTRYIAAGVLSSTTPQEQFAALQKAGYATDIKYAEKLNARLQSFQIS